MNFNKPKNSGMLLAALVAVASGLGVGVGGFTPRKIGTTRRVRNYPRMAVSPVAEIIAHNDAVKTRQVQRRKNMPRIKALRKQEAMQADYYHTLKQARLGRCHAI